MASLRLEDLIASRDLLDAKEGRKPLAAKPGLSPTAPEDLTLGGALQLWIVLTIYIIIRAVANILGWIAKRWEESSARRTPAKPAARRKRR